MDGSGAVNIGDVRLFISNVRRLPEAAVRYLKSLNQLFLLNDAGTVFLGPITPGVVGSLQNSQCALDGATSSAVVAGNNLTLNANITFQPIFCWCKEYLPRRYGHSQPFWTQVFSCLAPGTCAVPTPVPVSVTPNAGTATSAVFQAVVSDGSGAVNIGDVRLFISNVLSAPRGCYVRYLKSPEPAVPAQRCRNCLPGPITPGVVGKP